MFRVGLRGLAHERSRRVTRPGKGCMFATPGRCSGAVTRPWRNDALSVDYIIANCIRTWALQKLVQLAGQRGSQASIRR
jgi:hypothetical protein